MEKKLSLALIGDYDREVPAHRAIPEALRLSAKQLDLSCRWDWIGTDSLPRPADELLDQYDGIWLVPASPYADMAGALVAVRHARERNIPFLGTCGGFQHALLEYFRSVLGVDQADSLESNPESGSPLLVPLACPLVEVAGDILLDAASSMAGIYGQTVVREGYRCSFGFNAEFEPMLDGVDLKICARDSDGGVRGFELTGHSFFMGTLYQPERSAFEGRAHPLVTAFLRAAAGQ